MARAPEATYEGFKLPESPRWFEGELWFVDIFGKRVARLTTGGVMEDVALIEDDEPSGLGFLPDGTPIVVSMWQRKVSKIVDGQLAPHGDLGGRQPGNRLNDMVVDPRTGISFVDSIVQASSLDSRDYTGDTIAVVTPDGAVRSTGVRMLSPNGLALSTDGRTLYVAETRANTITCFSVGDDAALYDRRVFAETGAVRPDGICLDVEGGVWVAGGRARRFMRLLPGGIVADTINTGDRWALACCLGGPERNLLYLCTSATDQARVGQRDGTGVVEVYQVDVPGTGTP